MKFGYWSFGIMQDILRTGRKENNPLHHGFALALDQMDEAVRNKIDLLSGPR